MAAHYGTAIVPARPHKPRDREGRGGREVVQRWILTRLRNDTFFSLAAMNERIAELVPNQAMGGKKAYGTREPAAAHRALI